MTNTSFRVLIADDDAVETTEYFRLYIDENSLHYLVKVYYYYRTRIYIDDTDGKFSY